MTFSLIIHTDNAAFAPVEDADAEDSDWRRDEEVRRILADVAQRVRCGNSTGRCIDENGNTVGEWGYHES